MKRKQWLVGKGTLFNLHTEKAVKECKAQFGVVIKVQGEEIKSLQFFDDTVILPQTAKDL